MEARHRRLDREHGEMLHKLEMQRRTQALIDQFILWNGGKKIALVFVSGHKFIVDLLVLIIVQCNLYLTLSLPVTRICVNYSTVYNDTLVAKGLIHNFY